MNIHLFFLCRDPANAWKDRCQFNLFTVVANAAHAVSFLWKILFEIFSTLIASSMKRRNDSEDKKYLSCHRFLLRCVYYHFRAFSSQEQKEICHHIQNTIFCITIWFNIWIFIFLSFTSLWAFFKVFLHFLKLMWPEFHLDALIIWLGVRTTLQIIIFLIRDKMWMALHLDLCVLLSSTPLICLHSNRPW